MAGREKPPLIPALVMPGPGYYDGEFTAIKPKPPHYTMRGKYQLESHDSKPGPGAHCPEKYYEKRSSPAISFGIAHSPFAGTQKSAMIPDRYVQCLLANRPDKDYP
ncbi:outer dense fiber protein 3-like protein 2 [Drosophila miranda]|uniref:outer dense fiber protein 3-like protein 2 n=1 Tax=Drosophila miranda TaxID=7229 RepID=UPI0007E81257|nr:outer dense fiber protein 3-like protein 2 [Drosophila miranda]